MDKKAVFAGSFYPENSEQLNQLLESFKQDIACGYKSKAIIVPHAGYVYSGYAAMAGYQHFEPSENVFIIAPSHQEYFNNIAFPKYSFYETPLGLVEVNNRLIKEIATKFPSIIANEPFEKEHAIEVQLPFLQHLFINNKNSSNALINTLHSLTKKIKIIPVLVGKCDYRVIAKLIAEYWENSSFIISSDLSHYYSYEQARQLDLYTATIIETGRIEFLEQQQACGMTCIKALVDFANKNKCSMIRAEMYNSGDIAQDKDRVVGYGSWFMYKGSKNELIKKYFSEYIMALVKASIYSKFNDEEFVPNNIPTVLKQHGASFVTLKLNGQLRGCIGSVYPTKPLVVDIMNNAINAAFQDNRFAPLSYEEFINLEISVSILSEIERINFKNEKDLLSKIYPHGIIIMDRGKRALYLPEVWEQLPEKDVFFNSLKEKAGLESNYFSKTLEVYKFETVAIFDEDDQ